jgi:short subunit dehydrogenase-like uncharacterized protein
MIDKNFDVVVYGATGFTGKLVVEYMQKMYGNDAEISWAIAGRSSEKLTSVSGELGVGSDVPHLIVDSNDSDSITKMVQQTKCVLTNCWAHINYMEKIFFNNVSLMELITLICVVSLVGCMR